MVAAPHEALTARRVPPSWWQHHGSQEPSKSSPRSDSLDFYKAMTQLALDEGGARIAMGATRCRSLDCMIDGTGEVAHAKAWTAGGH